MIQCQALRIAIISIINMITNYSPTIQRGSVAIFFEKACSLRERSMPYDSHSSECLKLKLLVVQRRSIFPSFSCSFFKCFPASLFHKIHCIRFLCLCAFVNQWFGWDAVNFMQSLWLLLLKNWCFNLIKLFKTAFSICYCNSLKQILIK